MKTVSSFVVLLAVVLVPIVGLADTPVVVAVDTSRSLSAADLDEIRSDVQAIVDTLPATTPIGLIAFNDSAAWLTPIAADREAFTTALAAIRPDGTYTVFHDALFLAVRELDEGGVILVTTDGRDENSATTVDDVARLCDEHKTRILTTGAGRGIDERALRRFALLSNGTYLGTLRGADPAAISAAITDAQAGVATDARSAIPPTPAPLPTQVVVVQGGEATAPGIPNWFFAVLALAVVAVVVWLFTRRRAPKEPETRSCGTCGATLEPWETECPTCAAADLPAPAAPDVPEHEVMADPPPVAESAVQDESIFDPAIFDKSPTPAGLDQTMVLDEQPVLVTKQRGKPPRTYTLPKEQIFAVGRAPDVNTLTLDDPTISAQHFKVVPKDGEFYVVDLGATNGTSVNHERIKVRRLNPGDVIRVGMVEFEFTMKIRRMS